MNSLDNPAFFHQLFRGIPEAVAILDADDRVVVVNEQFETFFGYSLGQIQGHKINDLVVPPEFLEEGVRNSRLVLEGTPLMGAAAVRSRSDGSRVHVSITARPIYLEGRQAAIVVMYRDISDQGILLDSIDTHIWYLKDPDTYGAVNEAHAQFYGLTKQEMQNRRLEEFFDPVMAARLRENNREVFTRALPAVVERWTERADGQLRLLRIRKKPRFDTGDQDAPGEIRYVVCTAEDITAAREQENELRLLSSMVEQSADPMLRLDRDYRIAYANPAAETHYGWSLEELRGKDPALFNAEDNSEDIQKSIRAMVQTGRIYEGRVHNRRKDGSTYIAQLRIAPIMDEEGEIIGYVDVKRDITAEQQELETKELLLREVQHRVKNNLATVVSLLALQASGIEEPVAVDALNDARRRIEAMLTVYEALHLTTESGEIDLRLYLESLIARLQETLHAPGPIQFHCSIEKAPIESSAAISLGMIVNELLTNAVKHAFPRDRITPGRECRIEVELRRDGADDGSAYTVSVADNGISMPGDVDVTGGSRTLGLTLVISLVQKLRGTVAVERDAGTRIIIRIP